MTSTCEAIGQFSVENLTEEPTASFVTRNNLELKNISELGLDLTDVRQSERRLQE